jgi:hypothetical protein
LVGVVLNGHRSAPDVFVHAILAMVACTPRPSTCRLTMSDETDWQERYKAAEERRVAERDKILAAAGVRVPNPYVPFDPSTHYSVKGRPRWLAFILRTLDRLNPFA